MIQFLVPIKLGVTAFMLFAVAMTSFHAGAVGSEMAELEYEPCAEHEHDDEYLEHLDEQMQEYDRQLAEQVGYDEPECDPDNPVHIYAESVFDSTTEHVVKPWYEAGQTFNETKQEHRS